MSFRVVPSTDEGAWLQAFAALPREQRDVHFTHAYARVQEHGCDGKALLAVWSDEHSHIIQPFLLQAITIGAESAIRYYDIKSLYGFGGPVGIGSARAFDVALNNWAIQHNVVSEYCALHPLLWMYQLPLLRESARVIFTKDTIVVDLCNFDLARLERRVRRGVKRAQRDYGVIEVESPCVFDALYRKSMDRLEAQPHWRFGQSYWEAHDKGVDARWFFVSGFENDPGIRRGLLTIGRGVTAYAHFLGSDGEARDAGLDELLYFQAAKALHRSGYLWFHLGGGLTESDHDPLLFFKSGFSPLRYRVGSYRRVFIPQVYSDLTARCVVRNADPNWFPAYRAFA